MSDEETQSPIPWGLVEHVHRSKSGKTTMQISLPIELRARMVQAALDLGCSKLALVRVAISQFVMAHEENRSRGQERAYAAVSEIPPPVPGHEPVEAGTGPVEATESEPEPEPTMDPPRSRKRKKS